MESAASFIGYYVSLACDNESVYEGEVGDIDASRQLITLTHAHQLLPGGETMRLPQITVTGNHIKNLRIIRERIKAAQFHDPSESLNSKVKELSVNDKLSPSSNRKNGGSPKYYSKSFPQSPAKKKKNNTDQNMYPDFNFEENLAKFDKQAVFEEMIQNSQQNLPGGVPDYEKKMKSHENVLESVPVSLRQIKVPVEHAGKEYSTEDGFIVPSITSVLKTQLFSAAEKAGLSQQLLAENGGICTCQMALQLVGGSLRLNPQNNHQRPEIVVLAGCHMQGLQAICASRHLVNHTTTVLLYLPESASFMQSQIDLFLKSGGKLIRTNRELPSQPVDMIIDAMIGHEKKKIPDWLPSAISWANQNKAPLLSIDPCTLQVKMETPDIKWAIVMGLPLIKSPKVSRLYLADLGIPRGIYSDVGIQYLSPFKDKYYIPIYDV